MLSDTKIYINYGYYLFIYSYSKTFISSIYLQEKGLEKA